MYQLRSPAGSSRRLPVSSHPLAALAGWLVSSCPTTALSGWPVARRVPSLSCARRLARLVASPSPPIPHALAGWLVSSRPTALAVWSRRIPQPRSLARRVPQLRSPARLSRVPSLNRARWLARLVASPSPPIPQLRSPTASSRRVPLRSLARRVPCLNCARRLVRRAASPSPLRRVPSLSCARWLARRVASPPRRLPSLGCAHRLVASHPSVAPSPSTALAGSIPQPRLLTSSHPSAALPAGSSISNAPAGSSRRVTVASHPSAALDGWLVASRRRHPPSLSCARWLAPSLSCARWLARRVASPSPPIPQLRSLAGSSRRVPLRSLSDRVPLRSLSGRVASLNRARWLVASLSCVRRLARLASYPSTGSLRPIISCARPSVTPERSGPSLPLALGRLIIVGSSSSSSRPPLSRSYLHLRRFARPSVGRLIIFVSPAPHHRPSPASRSSHHLRRFGRPSPSSVARPSLGRLIIVVVSPTRLSLPIVLITRRLSAPHQRPVGETECNLGHVNLMFTFLWGML
ncbi:hypothetical protein A4X13_0g2520 [Tilletia indica]|uniref:Uncharacterized protein n=1 Tax=Tilletia indica TaxID=43049 RepID=A0A8T8T7K0_9BASI|nr:hypothetical protein A4X13_0g2520 [Tilletia indica]